MRPPHTVLVILSVLLGSVQLHAAFGGQLEVRTKRIQQGSSFTVRYAPGTLLERSSALWLSVYAFTAEQTLPTATSIPLVKNGSSYTAEVPKISKDIVFILMKVGTPSRTDWNNDRMWDAIIYDDAKPLRGALFQRAFSYLPTPLPNIRRKDDLDKALEAVRAEIAEYPDNTAAKIALASFLLDKQELTKEEYTTRVEALVNEGADTGKEDVVRMSARALRSIGRPADADRMESAFIARNAASDLAEEAARSACYAAQTREEFEDKLKSYIARFPYNVFSDRMYMDLLNSYLQQGSGDDVIRLIRAYPVPPGVRSNPPATILNMVAVSMLSQDSLTILARQYVERALRSVESAQIERPRFMTSMEFEAGQTEIAAIVHDTYGFILMKLKKTMESVEEFRKAVELLGDAASKDMLEHYANALRDAGMNDEALAVTKMAIRTARDFPQTIQRFHELSAGDVEVRNKELAALKAESAPERRIALRLSMMNYDIQKLTFTTSDSRQVRLSDFVLRRMDGSRVSFNDLKGKVVVVDFWATWCGPCRMAMPYMQKVYEAYRDDKNVQIILVNVWERGSDTTESGRFTARKNIVTKFLEQNPTYTFPMMIDVNDEIVGCFGVTGIPTKFYIDKNGVVQFKEVGVAGADVFVEDAREKIDVLLEELD